MTHSKQFTSYNNLALGRGLMLLLLLSITLLYSTLGSAGTLFYAGDYDLNNPNFDGLANENDAIVPGSPYGAAVYQNFIVPDPYFWHVTGLSTNNYLAGLTPRSAYWEIRRGVSAGRPGTLIASGNATDMLRGGGSGIYENLVNVDVTLVDSGTYWFAVVPQAPGVSGRSFNVNTFGLNGIGSSIRDQEYFNSPYFGSYFKNADNFGPYPSFSDRVYGTAFIIGGPVPEPSSLVMLGSGVILAAGGLRRYLFAK